MTKRNGREKEWQSILRTEKSSQDGSGGLLGSDRRKNVEKKMAGGVENAVAGRRLSDDGVVRSQVPGPKLK